MTAPPAGRTPEAPPHRTGAWRAVPEGGPVDAHVHFWDPSRLDYPWLRDVPALDMPFLPGQLLGTVPRADQPAGVVAVEADRLPGQALAEARWLATAQDPALPVVGVVAHASLEEGGLEPLRQLADVPLVTGVRRLLQDEPPGFATRPGFVSGAALLARTHRAFDLCVRAHQLVEATQLARRVPDVTFVLDHLGKPRIDPAGFRGWAADLARFAALPNVRCKLSGLSTEAEPARRTPADLLPFLRHALDVFGPERCMFGSDWPVLTLAWEYGQWLDLVRLAVADLTGTERDRVLRGTALQTYAGARAGACAGTT